MSFSELLSSCILVKKGQEEMDWDPEDKVESVEEVVKMRATEEEILAQIVDDARSVDQVLEYTRACSGYGYS